MTIDDSPVFAGIHAREWISPAVCTYVIREVVENAAANGYVDQINFHFLPVANPDGYEYSRNTVSAFKNSGPKENSCFRPKSHFRSDFGGRTGLTTLVRPIAKEST